MELIAQLPVLMLGAVLALSTERFAANRKLRSDHRSYRRRMRRNHGQARRQRQDPLKP